MNFLSHYYFDRDTTNCYHTLGTVLPDLLKNADKHIIIHPERLVHHEPEINDMIKGWQKHLEVDRYFHSSDFFVTHSHKLKLLLTPALEGSPVKPFFLGHIAVELVLDNLLLTSSRVSAHDFYAHLGGCNNELVRKFLNFAGLLDTDRFFRFYEKFKSSRYLETYTETPQIAYALKRVCMRIWDNPFTPAQQEVMTEIITRYRKDIYCNFMLIFDEISNKLTGT